MVLKGDYGHGHVDDHVHVQVDDHVHVVVLVLVIGDVDVDGFRSLNSSGEVWYDELSNSVMFMRVESATPRGKQIKTTRVTEFIAGNDSAVAPRASSKIKTTRVTEFIAGVEPDQKLFSPLQVPEGFSVQDFRSR